MERICYGDVLRHLVLIVPTSLDMVLLTDSSSRLKVNVHFATGCQRRYIAVAPDLNSNTPANTAAEEFVIWGNKLLSNISGNATVAFKYFKSQSSFENAVESSAYSLDPNVPIYSSAVIFTSGYPDWEYTVRLNRTFYFAGSQYRLRCFNYVC